MANISLSNVNLMNDAMFKAFRCHENNRELVVDFLSSVTNIPKEVLLKGKFLGGMEILKRNINNKRQIMDMNVLLDDKRRIIVEMNQYSKTNIFNKNTSYAFSIIIESTSIKMKKYPKTLLINIDAFNHFKTKKPVLKFKIRDEEGHIETDMYESIHFVLANINNKKYNVDKEIRKFLSFLKETNLEDLNPMFMGDERYMAAKRTVKDLTTNPEFIGYYDYEEARKDELEEEKYYARQVGYDEGRTEGHTKGHAEGLIEGIKSSSMEIAKKMLTLPNVTIEQIVLCTGLDFKVVESLKEQK